MLYAIGLTPKLIQPNEFPSITSYGLGLTDLAKDVSGADGTLPRGSDSPDELKAKILRQSPAILAFVGKRPAKVFFGRAVDYGLQRDLIGSTRSFVLPSPSGAARRYWDETWWHQLASLCRELEKSQ